MPSAIFLEVTPNEDLASHGTCQHEAWIGIRDFCSHIVYVFMLAMCADSEKLIVII